LLEGYAQDRAGAGGIQFVVKVQPVADRHPAYTGEHQQEGSDTKIDVEQPVKKVSGVQQVTGLVGGNEGQGREQQVAQAEYDFDLSVLATKHSPAQNNMPEVSGVIDWQRRAGA